MRNMKGSVGIYLFIIDTLIRLNSRLGMLLFLNFCKALNKMEYKRTRNQQRQSFDFHNTNGRKTNRSIIIQHLFP